ncbi:MAG: hypothetical protein CMM47_06605 [Rhodospirillaceae bacterium]|nr:hypothetical protein [Rhodospirillaceae bacterium]
MVKSGIDDIVLSRGGGYLARISVGDKENETNWHSRLHQPLFKNSNGYATESGIFNSRKRVIVYVLHKRSVTRHHFREGHPKTNGKRRRHVRYAVNTLATWPS